MKLLFLNGSRGEWGYVRPIIRHCMKEGIDYSICATNMLLLSGHGSLIDEIRADEFSVSDEIYMSLEGDNHYSMTKSLSVFLASFVDVLHRQKPTWIILAGDRGEQLMGAVAGAYTYIPVAHIQAGERSGNIDGTARHAIGKLAHLHFAANQDAAERLRRSGEEDFRIHVVGAPQLDELVESTVSSPERIRQKFDIDVAKPYLLVIQHPVTEEMDRVEEQAHILCTALQQFDMPKVWIMPNNDAGASILRRTILYERKRDVLIFENLSRSDFLGLMKHCRALVGNSSAGLLEAPTFKVAAVNLGYRQAGRVHGVNVINAPFELQLCVKAIERALSPDFQATLQHCTNLYGDGKSSSRILSILKNTMIDDRLLAKRITY